MSTNVSPKLDLISQHLIGYVDIDLANSESVEMTINEINFQDMLSNSYVKLSGYSNKALRSIKLEIEELILKKIKVLEDIEANNVDKKRERSVYYSKDFSIDRVGNQVILGQTGIAEGWTIPIYKTEYPDLLGLPFTEDHALTSSLRTKKPKQECFNCLSTDHRVTECPVKINNERIAMHRSEFNSQSMGQDQMFSTRYTSDPDAKLYRGFIPGKLSDQLKEALGCNSNQLPPFVYFMREYGYPEGWLIEAQVNSDKLSVHNGDNSQPNDVPAEDLADGEMKSPSKDPSSVEYDQNRIYSFMGFNEPIPTEFIDESDKFRVKRYSKALSREVFLSTLNLEKKKVVKRRSVYRNDSQSDDKDDEDVKAENDGENSQEKCDDEEHEKDLSESMSSPPPTNRSGTKDLLGKSFNEIPGTPIVENVKDVKIVPDWEKFSKNICEHKMYEMSAGTPTGSYQKIVNLTREYKTAMDEPPKFNND